MTTTTPTTTIPPVPLEKCLKRAGIAHRPHFDRIREWLVEQSSSSSAAASTDTTPSSSANNAPPPVVWVVAASCLLYRLLHGHGQHVVTDVIAAVSAELPDAILLREENDWSLPALLDWILPFVQPNHARE